MKILGLLALVSLVACGGPEFEVDTTPALAELTQDTGEQPSKEAGSEIINIDNPDGAYPVTVQDSGTISDVIASTALDDAGTDTDTDALPKVNSIEAGSCNEGTAKCAPEGTLVTCTQGEWVSTPCPYTCVSGTCL